MPPSLRLQRRTKAGFSVVAVSWIQSFDLTESPVEPCGYVPERSRNSAWNRI
jgi:hypothetical protein